MTGERSNEDQAIETEHLRTDPACVLYVAPKPGSRLDETSRGLSCPRCMSDRWVAPGRSNATNESALVTIVRVVSETYTDAGVLLWLNAKNRHLPSRPDGNWRCTPAEYIAAGHAAEVLEAARRIEGES